MVAIARYTAEQWGEEQARAYVTALYEMFVRLVRTPRLDRRCPKLGRGLWRVRRLEHLIYFRPADGSVSISRVLHKRMDPSDRF